MSSIRYSATILLAIAGLRISLLCQLAVEGVPATIGCMMFTAGEEGDPATSTHVWPEMQAYDAVRNSWTEYADMATPVYGSAAVAYDGSIVIPGGGLKIGGDPTQLVQSFKP